VLVDKSDQWLVFLRNLLKSGYDTVNGIQEGGLVLKAKPSSTVM